MSENCEWIHLLFLGQTFRFDNFVILFYRIGIFSLQRKITVKVQFLSILFIVVLFSRFLFPSNEKLGEQKSKNAF